jgi:CHAT domain-containing protein/Tfp pilus assembly protein PilF
MSEFRRLVLGVLLSLALWPHPSVGPTPAAAQPADELATLNRRIVELYDARKYSEALPIAEHYAEGIKARHGADAPQYAIALNNVAQLLRATNRLAEAEPLLRHALAIDEKSYGPEHPKVVVRLNGLAQLLRTTNRLTEAEPLFKRALAIDEKEFGAEHSEVVGSLSNLAELYRAQARYAEAEPLYKRSVAIGEKALGPDHVSVGASLNELGLVYERQSRYDEVEPLYERALAIAEKALGPDHPNVASSLGNLAGVHEARGLYGQAEPLYKRALAICEKALGSDHPRVGTSLNNLGLLYAHQGRYAEAEPLYKRALTIGEKALGPEHPTVSIRLNNLANLYREQDRFAEAEGMFKRALAINERALGLDHPSVATSLNSLGELYAGQGRYTEAEPLYKGALAIREKSLGPDHPHVGDTLNNLAGVYRSQRRYAEAELLYKRSLEIAERQYRDADNLAVAVSLNNLAVLYSDQGHHAEAAEFQKRALAIRERKLSPEHPLVWMSISNLGAQYAAQSDWQTATSYWRKSTELLVLRSRRGIPTVGATLIGQGKSDAERQSHHFQALIKAAYRLGQAEKANAPQLLHDMFRTAQWAQSSEAASSLAQMTARHAKADDVLARLVRERQDLVGEWQNSDKALIAARSSPPDKRNSQAESALLARLAAIDGRMSEIDQVLANDFPDYAALANPEPLTVAEVGAHLLADEALVLFLSTRETKPMPEESFVWVVTKNLTRWIRVGLGTRALTERVVGLRCGLDQAAWDGDGAARCNSLLKSGYTTDRQLPFDLAGAHELYQALFGQAEELIRDKRLLIVPSGPLAALPFQVLVTQAPVAAVPADSAAYANAAWLAKRHAIAVLPSVASLKALRQFAKASRATRPFIGFGNPLLTGPDGRDRRAWQHQTCSASPAPVRVASRGVRSTIPRFFRDGLADVEQVRVQYPLPETADELCAVAQSIGAGDTAVHLGERASETAIKALSANGILSQVKVVHFATHGLLAGETEMLTAAKAEPALILTPPQAASEEDDGLLTASEISQLRLDADWVVLSACNTAAGESDKPGAEQLSGLARAFFYAGARALLVSHWAVNSEATVKLITGAFDKLNADPRIGRAEALRHSMLSLIKQGRDYAHPANWAPFVVVGEGAR